MEIFFSPNMRTDVADYINSLYPSGKVAYIGSDEELKTHLVENGIKVVTLDDGEASEDDIRVYAASGNEEAIEKAKGCAGDKPLVLAPDYAYGNVFLNYTILGNRIKKCKYPNAIFYDIAASYEKLSASAYAGAFGVYAEALDRAISARRTPGVIEARGLVRECLETLQSELTAEELIRRTAAIQERLNEGGISVLSVARALYPAEADDNPIASYFMNAYIAVLIAIRFTKFDFCSILLGKDDVRARILAERIGLAKAEVVPYTRDLEPYRMLTEKFIPSYEFVEEALMRYKLECGEGKADLKMLLGNYALAASYGDYGGIIAELAQSGFIDAIIDETA